MECNYNYIHLRKLKGDKVYYLKDTEKEQL